MKTLKMAIRFTGNGSIIERAMLMARDIPIHASWTLKKYLVLGSILCVSCMQDE